MGKVEACNATTGTSSLASQICLTGIDDLRAMCLGTDYGCREVAYDAKISKNWTRNPDELISLKTVIWSVNETPLKSSAPTQLSLEDVSDYTLIDTGSNREASVLYDSDSSSLHPESSRDLGVPKCDWCLWYSKPHELNWRLLPGDLDMLSNLHEAKAGFTIAHLDWLLKQYGLKSDHVSQHFLHSSTGRATTSDMWRLLEPYFSNPNLKCQDSVMLLDFIMHPIWIDTL